MHPKTLIKLWLCIAFAGNCLAQKPNEKYQYHIHPASAPIKVDGIADDQGWESAETATDFFMITPMDTSFSRARTEVKMTYDNDHMYILVINYKTVKGSIIVESLKRDFTFGKNDNFLLFMDTFDDRTNGFSFGANAAGAPWDGQMGDGGTVDLSWDNRWVSHVKNDDDKWVWEAAIPFKSIRYKSGISRWGINFSRQDLTISEKSAWAPVPRQFPSASSGLHRRTCLGSATTESRCKYFDHSIFSHAFNTGFSKRQTQQIQNQYWR